MSIWSDGKIEELLLRATRLEQRLCAQEQRGLEQDRLIQELQERLDAESKKAPDKRRA